MNNDWRVEVVNVEKHLKVPYTSKQWCHPLYCMAIIVIPGIETPFEGLGCTHTKGRFE